MYLLNSAGDTEQKERTSQQVPPQRQIPFEKYQVRLEYGVLNFVKYIPHQSLTSAGPTGPVRNSLYDKREDKSNPCLYLLLLLYLPCHYCCIEHSVRHHFGYFIIYLFISFHHCWALHRIGVSNGPYIFWVFHKEHTNDIKNTVPQETNRKVGAIHEKDEMESLLLPEP